MGTDQLDERKAEAIELQSEILNRTVRIDFFQAGNPDEGTELLLINDGQDLETIHFSQILKSFTDEDKLKPLLAAGIHSGKYRRSEYGMSVGPDYKGRGAKAIEYEEFIIRELLPFVRSRFHNIQFSEISFAGFSLGALSAFDIAWNHPDIFSKVGVFSGSLWLRSIDKEDKKYDPWVHRMMHHQVEKGEYHAGMKFFFECGEMDEWEDRNRNGVIDSIDDTIDLMRLLVKKGYREGKDLYYLQMPDGRHDLDSWARAIPVFLEWGFGKRLERET